MVSERERPRNVFVLGLDDFHQRDIERIPGRDRFAFHRLLEAEEVIHTRDIDATLAHAREQLREFDGPIDAIIGYWDFPSTAIVPMLCAEHDLPSASLEAVMKCAHKYWCRLEQHRHVPDLTPAFCAVDPFAKHPFDDVTIDFPFWIKPVCGYSSVLGFHIGKRAEFDAAIAIARDHIGHLGDPFDAVLGRVDARALAGVGGHHMIAEEILHGIELAPEGYVQHGEVHVHGVVDMVRAANRRSFRGYRYPSQHPRWIQDRTIAATRTLLEGIGFDHSGFNVEFFWHRRSDTLRVVEINARVSQSHSNLMTKVDGMSNFEVAVHVGLGDSPNFVHGNGQFDVAEKFLYRIFDTADARCVTAPDERDLAKLRKRQPETLVRLRVHEGMRLSETDEQDAYSWVLAELIIGGHSVRDINDKFEEAKALLPFRFEPLANSTADHGKESA